MLKPSLEEMLMVSKTCGLYSLQEAYDNYLNHYDLFFLIDNYQDQLLELTNEIKSFDLIESVDGKLFLKDISIEDVKNMVGLVNE